jgi:uncharacterized membrane protein YciS (DUF1049 family)
MRQFFTSTAGTASDWLIFLAILLVAGFILATFILWLTIFRKKGKKRRKNRNRRRQKNPSLAETGGLPPKRVENKTDSQPPSS